MLPERREPEQPRARLEPWPAAHGWVPEGWRGFLGSATPHLCPGLPNRFARNRPALGSVPDAGRAATVGPPLVVARRTSAASSVVVRRKRPPTAVQHR